MRIKMLVIFSLALVTTQITSAMTDDSYTPPNGLSLEWKKFIKKRDESKEYKDFFAKTKKNKAYPGFTKIETCLSQKNFNNCDLWWCIAHSRENYSKIWEKFTEERNKKTCSDPEVEGQIKSRISSTLEARKLCLEKYVVTKKLGHLIYTCEGLLD